MLKLFGPFTQIVTLEGLLAKGSIADEALVVINNGAVVTNGPWIVETGDFNFIQQKYPEAEWIQIENAGVLIPGFVDCHTHLIWGASRSGDYAKRIAGKTYLEIAREGGGIGSSVRMTRDATDEELLHSMLRRIKRHEQEGVTTIEIKTGYGLSVEQEWRMMEIIHRASNQCRAHIVPTCLAAHIPPPGFTGNPADYLQAISSVLLPRLKESGLCNRVDIFIEETAFSAAQAIPYLKAAAALGFDITVHADQFSNIGSEVAMSCGALSADHLEASGPDQIKRLAESNIVSVVLPGASIGLGMNFAPARKLLDAGACVAIASDWNPGSAPQGDLLAQAAILSTFEKLSTAEVFAGLCFRAALALGLHDRGRIAVGQRAHFQLYPTTDYREILYNQGKLKPIRVFLEDNGDGTIL